MTRVAAGAFGFLTLIQVFDGPYLGLTNANSHSSMVKSSLGINILAVLPLASNAGCAVSAAIIVGAMMAKTASKYFSIVFFIRSNRTLEGSINNASGSGCLRIFDPDLRSRQ